MRRLALADWLNFWKYMRSRLESHWLLTRPDWMMISQLGLSVPLNRPLALCWSFWKLSASSSLSLAILRKHDDNPPLQIENWEAPEIILAPIFWHIFLSAHLECGLFVWVSNTHSIHFGWSSSSWWVWRSWNQNDNMKEPTNTNHCVFLECAFLELLYCVRIAFVAFVRILNYKQLQGSCM